MELFAVCMDSILFLLTKTVKHFFVATSEQFDASETILLKDDYLESKLNSVQDKEVPVHYFNKKKVQNEQLDQQQQQRDDHETQRRQQKALRQKKLEKVGALAQDLKQMGIVMSDAVDESNSSLHTLQDLVDVTQENTNHAIDKINNKINS